MTDRDDAARVERQGRRINVGLMTLALALVIQSVAVGVWAGTAQQQINQLERQVRPLADGTVARLDERSRNIEAGIARIERRLDSMEARP